MSIPKIRKAVIPVAGLGTRFLPITKSIPKEMLPVIDRPILQIIIEEALASGIEHIVLVAGRNKTSIENYFDNNIELNAMLRDSRRDSELESLERIAHLNFSSVRQKLPLGLGHAVLCARPIIGNEPFAVLLGDDIIKTGKNETPGIAQLIEQYESSGVGQVALMTVPREEVFAYGAAEGSKGQGKEFVISKLVEKPPHGTEKTDQVIVGRYVLPPSIWNILENQVPGVGGEIQLTDALSMLLQQEGLMGCCFSGRRIDAGTRLGYFELNLLEVLERDELKNGALALIRQQLSEHLAKG